MTLSEIVVKHFEQRTEPNLVELVGVLVIVSLIIITAYHIIEHYYERRNPELPCVQCGLPSVAGNLRCQSCADKDALAGNGNIIDYGPEPPSGLWLPDPDLPVDKSVDWEELLAEEKKQLMSKPAEYVTYKKYDGSYTLSPEDILPPRELFEHYSKEYLKQLDELSVKHATRLMKMPPLPPVL
jgi:hypothetical protein